MTEIKDKEQINKAEVAEDLHSLGLGPITSGELAELNSYKPADDIELRNYRAMMGARALISARAKEFVDERAEALKGDTKIISGSSTKLEGDKLYIQVRGEVSMEKVSGQDTKSSFDMLVTNPYEDLSDFPESSQSQINNILGDIQVDDLPVDIKHIASFLLAGSKEYRKYSDIYRNTQSAYQLARSYIEKLEIPEDDRSRLLKLANEKIKFVRPMGYTALDRDGISATRNLIEKEASIISEFVEPITGPLVQSNPVGEKFLDLAQPGSKFFVVSGHSGQGSSGKFEMGENYGGNQTLSDILNNIDNIEEYDFLVVSGCNFSNVDLSKILELKQPIFFIDGFLSQTGMITGELTARYYDPSTQERLAFKHDMTFTLGISYDESTGMFERLS